MPLLTLTYLSISSRITHKYYWIIIPSNNIRFFNPFFPGFYINYHKTFTQKIKLSHHCRFVACHLPRLQCKRSTHWAAIPKGVFYVPAYFVLGKREGVKKPVYLYAYLARCQVANPGVGAVDGGLLYDPVACRLAVARVLRTNAVLPVEHATGTTKLV